MKKIKSMLKKKADEANRIQTEAELVSYVEEKVKDTESNANRQQAYINTAYFIGKQWLVFDSTIKRVIEPPKEPWEVRLVANRIQPIVRTELAKITKNKPISWVVPASEEQQDMDSAKIAEKVVEWLEYELKLQRIDRDNCLNGLTGGVGFIKPFWNPNKGDDIQDPETGEMLKTGAPDVDLCSIFDITLLPHNTKTWSEVRGFVHDRIRDVGEIKDIYGVEVPPEENLVNSNIYDAQLNTLNNTFGSSSYEPAKNSARVREYWELPSKNYPKGRRITIASGKLLFSSEDIGFGEEDTSPRCLPLFMYCHINVPGRTIGQSIIENLIPIQREYNKSRSQIIQHKNLMGNPKWVAEDNSMDEEPTDEPGQLLYYKKGYERPVQQPVASMGSDVYKNLESCIEEMYFVSGQQEVSHGSTPAGVTSGVAIGYLQEQDDTKLAPSIQNFIDCKQDYMSYLLKMCKYKIDYERTVTIVGKNKKVETLTFKGQDISSTTVRIVEGSMFEQSRPAKQQFVFDMIEAGILAPDQHADLIMEMLQIGSIERVFAQHNVDKTKAEQEESQWTLGDFEGPTVRDFQNHEIHIKCHNMWRNTEDYESLSPEQMRAVDEHVNTHEAMIQQTQATQPQGQEEPTAVAELVDGLTPEEQLALEHNPQILDEYYNTAGGIGNI